MKKAVYFRCFLGGAAIVFLLGWSCLAQDWPEAFGPSRPLAALGFGGIAAGIDATGGVVTLAWPNAGAYDQVSPPLNSDGVPVGCRWGLDNGRDRVWIQAPVWNSQRCSPPTLDSPALETKCDSTAMGISVTETLVLSPENGLLAARVLLEKPAQGYRFVWLQQCAPVPVDTPRLALPMPVSGSARGFASFYDTGRKRLYHFRPQNLSRKDWERARHLRDKRASTAEWSVFDDGTWCAVCLSPDAGSCQFEDAQGIPAEGMSAVGDCQAWLVAEDAAGSLPMAEAYMAFGNTRDAVDKQLDSALARGFDGILSDAQKTYASLVGPALPVFSEKDPARTRLLQDLRILLAAFDPLDGTVVAAPFQKPPLLAVWPELGAWTALAWQLAGYGERARRQLRFFSGPAERRSGGEKEVPGFAPLLWPDGSPAVPSFVSNPATAGWIVLAANQLVRNSPPDRRTREAQDWCSATILPIIQYLRRWSSPTTGGPPPGFDPALLRDHSSASNDLLYYLAGLGALELAGLAKQPVPPEWASWQRELEALLRFRLVNEPEGWELSPTLAAWAAFALPTGDPIRKAPVRGGSQVIPLGDFPLPPPGADTGTKPDNTLEAAVDLVALLHGKVASG